MSIINRIDHIGGIDVFIYIHREFRADSEPHFYTINGTEALNVSFLRYVIAGLLHKCKNQT
jgi:hypothetical protein